MSPATTTTGRPRAQRSAWTMPSQRVARLVGLQPDRDIGVERRQDGRLLGHDHDLVEDGAQHGERVEHQRPALELDHGLVAADAAADAAGEHDPDAPRRATAYTVAGPWP